MSELTAEKIDAAAFEQLYVGVIEPTLAPLEDERKRLWKRYWRWLVLLVIPGALLLAAVIAIIFGAATLFFWFAGFGAIAGAVLIYQPLGRFQTRCKFAALGKLADALTLGYEGAGFEPPAFDAACGFDLLPYHERSSFEDLFTGRRRGCDFALYEAHLEDEQGGGKNRRWVTTFRGQIIRIGFPKRFLGTTVVQRDRFFKWKREGFERVGLESSQFERAFEVYGTDQVEARYLVHPAFMARLIDFEAHVGGKKLRCLFDQGHLVIVVEGGNMFEVVNVRRPLPDKELTRKGVMEIQSVFDIMDQVLDPPHPHWGAKA
jgi:hypothetical protein